ncbi:MAG: Hpt domain-containing protein [Gammaproteobacteria bacterium]|nr:Hpt domain-containing protein [Gammaproteobacteria bacterium]
MNLQETSIRQSALGWVKKSIDDNLGEIEADLKRYIEDGDTALLEAVKQRLGMVQGVLMMIEQYGAAMLTEEMVALADFVAEQEASEPALEVLLRAVLQLPDYLEHIQSGHRDIPIAILPLLNDIRAVRNQDLFSEKLLFLPDLSMHQDGAEVETLDAQQNQASKLLAKKLRPIYQLALLNVIQEKSVEESLQRLEKVCETLEERSFSEQIARIWWIVGALLESVSRGQLELGVSIKNLLGKVDALFRVILIIGEGGLLKRQPIELIKNFLYYIAQPECDGPKTQAIKTAYRLEQFLPSESARSKVLDNIAGPNQALLKTVAESMKADIEEVKSTLEVYVNGDLARVEMLKDLPQEMHVISDTLAMIGLGMQRQLVETQIETVRRIVAGETETSEEQLLSMAAELLQVEQALDQMQKRQSVEPPMTESDISRDYEMDNVLSAVVTAALDDIQKTKNAILEFIKDPNRSENIELCVTLMDESRGALELMNQPRAVAVVDGLLAYLRGYDIVEFMEASRLDALSQVVVSLEYYLEALGEHRDDVDNILDFADVQLQELLRHVSINEAGRDEEPVLVVDEQAGQPDMPEFEPGEADAAPSEPRLEIVAGVEAQPPEDFEADEDTPAAAGPQVEGPADDIEFPAEPESIAPPAPVAEQGPAAEQDPADDADDMHELHSALDQVAQADDARVPAPAPSAPESAAATIEVETVADEPEVLKPGSDPEILEIYLEEADEESRNIARLQQDWMLHPEDENALKNIRRAFHTIKGSGRLVGAMKIGEFAWDYEQLLNRVIDKTIAPNDHIIGAVGKAARALPELVEELKTGTPPRADIGYLRGLARTLAEFNAEQVLFEHTQSMTAIESPYDRITGQGEDEILEPDTAEWQGDTGQAGTRMVPPGLRESGLLEDIEPETMKVDPAELTLPESAYTQAGETGFDDTMLAQAPEIAPPDAIGTEFEVTDVPSIGAGEFIDEVDYDQPAVDSAAVEAEDQLVDFVDSFELDNDDTVLARVGDTVAADTAASEAEIPTAPLAEARNDSDEVDHDQVAAEAAAAEAGDHAADFVDSFDLDNDDTLLAQPADLANAGLFAAGPGSDAGATDGEADSRDAIDYPPAAAGGGFAGHDAGEEEVIDAFGLESDDGEPREAIEIETIGEDFVGDEFDEDLDAEFSLDGAEATAMRAEMAEQTGPLPGDMPAADEQAVIEPPPQPAPGEFAPAAPPMESPAVDDALVEQSLSPTERGPTERGPDEGGSDEGGPTERGPDEGGQGEPAPTAAAGSEPAPEETPPDPFVETTRRAAHGEEAGETGPLSAAQDEPTGLSFDPELLIIYQQEVEQHLNTVNSALDRAEQIQELVPGEKIYRALHTIHGASRTADIATIGELAGLLEKPLKSALSQNLALDDEIVALYREGQRALEDMTRELVETRRLPRIPRDLEVSLRALAEDLEEYTVEIPETEAEPTGEFIDTLTMMTESGDAGQDDELLTIFVDEANELLEMSDNTLHNWSQQDSDDSVNQDFSAVMELQRYLHTLKGGARMAELKEISDLAHEMESIFIAVIDGRVEKDESLLEILRDCFDLLNTQVGEAQEGRSLSDCAAQVARLTELRRGEGGAEPEGLLEPGLDADSEDIDIVAENLTSEPLAGQERPNQDVIKVRSDLLDNLVNAAGEVSIYRARMEQQVAGLGSHLGELGQTIARLKGQLRNLEAETDAQIHYSHRAEARRDGEFDPLEMDRYTMIQELSRSLSESVNDLSSLQNMLGEQVKDSETLLLQQSRVNTDLQDGLIKSRMVRFSGLLSRLRRLVRQSSQELGKKAELLVSGEENEVDNKVLDRMVAPLEHIIRNALSHGIETPVERVKKGKPEIGRITIDITRDGSDVVIRVSDDGAGVNIEKVRSRAIQLGLLDETRQVSEADLVQYILEPGFSTADHVTQLSGRGVGMDVVDIEIKQLGGTLQIETNPGGTSFVARLPFTLSINQAILVRTDEEVYAIPLLNIEGITRLDTQQLAEYYRQENPELEYAGQQFALHALSRLVGGPSHLRAGADDEKQAIIFSRAGDTRVALHVDEILGNREIVVKTLGKQLSQVKGLAGASILADGSVVLILDVNGLVRQNVVNSIRIMYQGDEQRATRGRDTVMVVDDSITMRRVASKLLERHNYEVVTAKDGVDALAQLEDVRPDVMLLDIEMPRMDGFELATHMRNEESYSGIPIIMITSRTGEKHRDRAFEIGITNYMGKPYQEEELIENIQSALRAG